MMGDSSDDSPIISDPLPITQSTSLGSSSPTPMSVTSQAEQDSKTRSDSRATMRCCWWCDSISRRMAKSNGRNSAQLLPESFGGREARFLARIHLTMLVVHVALFIASWFKFMPSWYAPIKLDIDIHGNGPDDMPYRSTYVITRVPIHWTPLYLNALSTGFYATVLCGCGRRWYDQGLLLRRSPLRWLLQTCVSTSQLMCALLYVGEDNLIALIGCFAITLIYGILAAISQYNNSELSHGRREEGPSTPADEERSSPVDEEPSTPVDSTPVDEENNPSGQSNVITVESHRMHGGKQSFLLLYLSLFAAVGMWAIIIGLHQRILHEYSKSNAVAERWWESACVISAVAGNVLYTVNFVLQQKRIKMWSDFAFGEGASSIILSASVFMLCVFMYIDQTRG